MTNYEALRVSNSDIAFTYESDLVSKIEELEEILQCDKCPARLTCEQSNIFGCFNNFAKWASTPMHENVRYSEGL